MSGAKVGEIWKTYVLVSNHDPECWFTMNVDLSVVRERLDKDKHVEIWWYHRDERAGDVLIKKEGLTHERI